MGAERYRSIESPYQQLPISAREPTTLFSGMYKAEQDQRSAFRWADGDAAISWYPRGVREATVLSLSLGPPPPELVDTPLQISTEGNAIARWMMDARPRRYHILLPALPAVSPRVAIGLASAAVTIPPDKRSLGMRIEAIGFQSIGGRAWPATSTILVQTLMLLLGGGLLSVLLSRVWANLGGHVFDSLSLSEVV